MPEPLHVSQNGRQSILNPLEQRVYGAVHVAQGLTMMVVGARAPSLVLPYIMRKSRAKHAAVMSRTEMGND